MMARIPPTMHCIVKTSYSFTPSQGHKLISKVQVSHQL